MDAVEEIKNRLAIEDVVAEYVTLKRTGRNWKGLSPFNSEKTPSFVVSPEKQIWHDFSSGRGGNVFSFVMEKMCIRDSFKRVLSFVRESVQDKSGTMVRRRVRWWSALALLRSMASSPAAAAATLTTRAANLDADNEGEADEQGRSAVMDVGDDRDSLTVSDIVPGSDLGDVDDEGVRTRRRLLAMAKEALSLYGKPDTKLDLVTVQVKKLLEEGFNPIVFCRFIPTAEYRCV